MEIKFNDSGETNITTYAYGKSFFNSLGLDLPSALVTGFCLSIIIFMTIFGNVLVLLAVFVNPNLRSTTNFFIVNLAFADLFLGITVLPFSATLEILGYWPFGKSFCVIWAAVDVLWCTASIMTLCVISVDRYIGVTRPLKHSSIMTNKRAYLIIFLVWILSFIISVGPLLGWKDNSNSDPRTCHVNDEAAYALFSAAGSFYIPMIIICSVYVRIYKEASKHTSCLMRGIKLSKLGNSHSQDITLRVHTGGSNSQRKIKLYEDNSSWKSRNLSRTSSRKSLAKCTLAGKLAKFKREKKAAKTLGIVVGVFILCWFPFFFCLPLGALCKRCVIPEKLFKIIFWLGYCNSLMNPIIYGCSSREFKRAFRRIMKCQFHRKRALKKAPMSYANSMSELDRSFRNSRLNGHIRYQKEDYTIKPYHSVARNSDSLDNGMSTETKILCTARRHNCHDGSSNRKSQESSDSETISLSDHVIEALRLEQIEQSANL